VTKEEEIITQTIFIRLPTGTAFRYKLHLEETRQACKLQELT
jgi:hypothetical protein